MIQKSYSFSFDRLHLLGAFGNTVHIEGEIFEDEETPTADSGNDKRCVLVIKQPMLVKMLNAWVTAKKSLCELHNHYCGQMGSVQCEVETLGETNLTTRDEEKEEPSSITVPLMKVLSFDEDMDMEHG